MNKEIKNYCEIKQIIIQLWDAMKAVLNGNFIELSTAE
jgi:hypothetical protein